MQTSPTAEHRHAAPQAARSLSLAGPRDQLRVAGQVLAPILVRGIIQRRPAAVSLAARLDADRAAVDLLRELHHRYGRGPLWLPVLGQRILLVLSPEDARRMLEDTPSPFAPAGMEKRGALEQFQPHGVLTSQGPERLRRRAFNEAVLEMDHPVHGAAESFLPAIVEEARALALALGDDADLTWKRFSRSFHNTVRRVVLGDGARDDRRTTDLLDRLRAAANWSYLHPTRERTRAEFLDRVREHLDRADPASLAATIAAHDPDSDIHPESQVAHWMFAFDAAAIASYRALALVVSHPEAARAVEAELAGNPPVSVQGVTAQEHLRASLLESVRLWPTTLALLRETDTDIEWHGAPVPKGTTVAMISSFFHRDPENAEHADILALRPWIEGTAEHNWSIAPFSHGPGRCPGRDVVLFTATAFLAALLERRRFRLARPGLLNPGRPLPATFDHFGTRLASVPRV